MNILDSSTRSCTLTRVQGSYLQEPSKGNSNGFIEMTHTFITL